MDTEQRLDDHETRIRELEESTIRQAMQLSNLEKGQLEIKNLFYENGRDMSRLVQDLTNKMTDALTFKSETEEKKKLIDRKEAWGLFGALGAALVTGLFTLVVLL